MDQLKKAINQKDLINFDDFMATLKKKNNGAGIVKLYAGDMKIKRKRLPKKRWKN